MDEELQKLQDQIAELEEKLEVATKALGDKETAISEITTERDDLKSTISEYEQRELIASRTAALVEAGVTLPNDPEKLASKQAHWASMSDEAFNSTVEDLKDSIEASKKAEPVVSLAERLRRPTAVPRFTAVAEEGEERPSYDSLRGHLRSLARTSASAESE
jgi:chromosome segregation ATPase